MKTTNFLFSFTLLSSLALTACFDSGSEKGTRNLKEDDKRAGKVVLLQRIGNLSEVPLQASEMERGSKIQLFVDSTCTQTASEEIEISSNPQPFVSKRLSEDREYKFYFNQQTSEEEWVGCFEVGGTYILDRQAPEVPSFQIARGVSGGRNPWPIFEVSNFEDHAHVQLFWDGTCHLPASDSLVLSTESATIRSFELTSDTLKTYSFYIKQKDLAGNESPCTSHALRVDYAFDKSILVDVLRTTPSPNNEIDLPAFSATGFYWGEKVQLFGDAHCTESLSDPVHMTGEDQTLDIQSSHQLVDGSYHFYYQHFDHGRRSLCRLVSGGAYLFDTTAPDAPGITLLTGSPSQITTPLVRVSGLEEGGTFQLFSDSSCTMSMSSEKKQSFFEYERYKYRCSLSRWRVCFLCSPKGSCRK